MNKKVIFEKGFGTIAPMMVDIEERLVKLEAVGVILRPGTPSLKHYYLDVKSIMAKYNIETLIDEASAEMIGMPDEGSRFVAMCKRADLLISIGGDGTLISMIRRGFRYQKPIVGINLGNLGFLTDIRSDEVENMVHRLLNHDYRIDQRMLMQVDLKSGEKKQRYFTINDMVIRHKFSKMAHIKLYLDGNLANSYYGDALIVSTPTGATGYNLSAGGPIVFPYAKNFVFTPICPHSLTQRPLVLPVRFDVRLKVEEEGCMLILDGQTTLDFHPGDMLRIKMSPVGAKMLHRKERNFFHIIREKLNWGDTR